jgi:hypothetical protein
MPRNHTSFNPKTYEHIPATNIIGNDSDSTNIYYNVMIYNNSTNYDPSGILLILYYQLLLILVNNVLNLILVNHLIILQQ